VTGVRTPRDSSTAAVLRVTRMSTGHEQFQFPGFGSSLSARLRMGGTCEYNA
jgi:hypothetical protein